jgi:DNA-binding MarR family transcriptional regulator
MLISVYLAGPVALDYGTLSRDLRVTKANVSWVLAGLERQGLIKRRPDPSDGRKIRARVTAAGKAVLKELVPIARDCCEEALADLGDRERQQLKQLATRVA